MRMLPCARCHVHAAVRMHVQTDCVATYRHASQVGDVDNARSVLLEDADVAGFLDVQASRQLRRSLAMRSRGAMCGC
eukprot:363433-Chlamydomonas_euryale.AAC.31